MLNRLKTFLIQYNATDVNFVDSNILLRFTIKGVNFVAEYDTPISQPLPLDFDWDRSAQKELNLINSIIHPTNNPLPSNLSSQYC